MFYNSLIFMQPSIEVRIKSGSSRYNSAALRDYLIGVLIHQSDKAGFSRLSKDIAGITADALIFADESHTFSHGVNTIDTYNLKKIAGGQIVPTAVPKRRDGKYDCVGTVLGNHALGHHAAYEAVQWVMEKARKNGIAKVYVRDANHFGAAGYWSYLISQEGDMESFVNCTGSAFVAPYGGIMPALGTNPIAWSIPFEGGLMNLDMATALHASNYTIKALKEGWDRLPFPVAKFTDEGILVTDDPADFGHSVEVFLKTGGGLPLGYNEDEHNAGYKGSGLAWMIKGDSVLGGEFAGVISSDPARRK